LNTALNSEIESRRAEIAAICARLGVRRLELFGSGTRSPAPHDLDFLVDLGERPPAEYAAAYFALREQLEALFRAPRGSRHPARAGKQVLPPARRAGKNLDLCGLSRAPMDPRVKAKELA